MIRSVLIGLSILSIALIPLECLWAGRAAPTPLSTRLATRHRLLVFYGVDHEADSKNRGRDRVTAFVTDFWRWIV